MVGLKQPSRSVLIKRCSESLLKSHFGMGVLLQICCIDSEHFFLRTPLEGCFLLVFTFSLGNSHLKKFRKILRKISTTKCIFCKNEGYLLFIWDFFCRIFLSVLKMFFYGTFKRNCFEVLRSVANISK